MKKIFKYPLPAKEKYELELPLGAQIIRVEDVDGLFFLWAAVNPEEHLTESRYLEFYKTGQEIHTPMRDLKFLGICKMFIMQELCLYVFENKQKYRKNTLF
jgi:hypothetical protein